VNILYANGRVECKRYDGGSLADWEPWAKEMAGRQRATQGKD